MTRKAMIPSIKDLEKWYVDEKLSTWKIEKKYGYCRGTLHRYLKKYGLNRNLSVSHIVYPRKPFSGNLVEKAYLIGFRLGDLRVRKGGHTERSETIKVDCSSTKIEQINMIKKLFSKYGRVWIG